MLNARSPRGVGCLVLTRSDELEARYDQTTLPLPAEPRDASDSPATLSHLACNGTKPFLKWAGGKSRLLGRILPFVPPAFGSYYEPFLGGGAMFFSVRRRATKRCYLSDLNEELINAWLAVQRYADELTTELQYYAEQDSKDFYLFVRTLRPIGIVDRAARFIYLNQTSWNGLWRVNKWGEFNVPWGDRPFRGLSDELLTELHVVLSDVTIEQIDFREALKRPERGDFVYLDPPYLPLSDTSKFHLYTEQRFRLPDLRQLALLCRELSERGVTWILSNRDTPDVRALFSDAEIIGLTVNRAVAAQNVRDVEARYSPEVIIVGRSRA